MRRGAGGTEPWQPPPRRRSRVARLRRRRFRANMAAVLLLLRALRRGPTAGPGRLRGSCSGWSPGLTTEGGRRCQHFVYRPPIRLAGAGGQAKQVTADPRLGPCPLPESGPGLSRPASAPAGSLPLPLTPPPQPRPGPSPSPIGLPCSPRAPAGPWPSSPVMRGGTEGPGQPWRDSAQAPAWIFPALISCIDIFCLFA